jgi:cation:H+ antiporter
MIADILLTLGGFALLVWGVDRFVAGASSLASNLGVAPILIGLTIVGFATSAPEIMVSASAAAQGLTGLAVGNAIGSNIANIGLVLGATALLQPISSSTSRFLRGQVNALIFLSLATVFIFFDNQLGRLDGLILIAALVVFLFWLVRKAKNSNYADTLISEVNAEIPKGMNLGASLLWIAIGFGVLLLGANMLINGAENLARAFGVSELVIGLTIVAVGTSLPELAVSIISVMKNEQDIAVGNIIGSNVFNLLAVIGIAGIIHPAELDPSVLMLHFPIMIVLTLALLRIAYNPFGKPGIGRLMGLILLSAFVAYQAMLLSGYV